MISDCPTAIDPPEAFVTWYKQYPTSPEVDMYIESISNQQQDMLRHRQNKKPNSSFDLGFIMDFITSIGQWFFSLLPNFSIDWK